MERWSDEIVEIADDATNDFMEHIGNPKPGAVPAEMAEPAAPSGDGGTGHSLTDQPRGESKRGPGPKN